MITQDALLDTKSERSSCIQGTAGSGKEEEEEEGEGEFHKLLPANKTDHCADYGNHVQILMRSRQSMTQWKVPK